MKLIDLSIDEKRVLPHKNVPVPDKIKRGISLEPMPQLEWYRISALGFGRETEGIRQPVFPETDVAASLFAASGTPFSLLCERGRDSSQVVFAIGCTDPRLVGSILQCSFGTAKYARYIPVFPAGIGLYAVDFDVVRMDIAEIGKYEGVSEVHVSDWADEVTHILTDFPGMVRIDFHPLDSEKCSPLMRASQKTRDKITAYLESTVQVSDSVSADAGDNAIKGLVKELFGNDKMNHSASSSIAWKESNSRLESIRKEEEFFSRLLSCAQKDGWIVDFTVSADIGLGTLRSSEIRSRANALAVPVSAAIVKAGYTCSWDDYGGEIKKSDVRGMIMPASALTEMVSFPTTSFYGFMSVKNRYYNVNIPQEKDSVPIADLLRFDHNTGITVFLPRDQINRHIFVCGMTGSGKTNTVHHLLSGIGDLPFLVIEPVKSEYSSLPGVQTYTMTAGSSQAVHHNPFWFPAGGSLQYHIGCLTQIISSAFDLYASMQNMLEQCLIRTYLHCGWDLVLSKNMYLNELPEEMLYPTFNDLCREAALYSEKAESMETAKDDSCGDLLSRLQSFTSGAKGMLFNTAEHISFEEFERNKVVISLDSLADDAEKCMVMGIILAQYYQFLKMRCRDAGKNGLRHITVIEEAHCLFANTAPAKTYADGGGGQIPSQGMVQMFNNILSEIRAYGEGFIIVDQSPCVLHPAVLKNTGIKIAHRMDYGKDIDVMQEVLLFDKNNNELAALETGVALLRFGGMHSPAKVYIPHCETKENTAISASEEISGNSIVNILFEDKDMEIAVKGIVERLLNQLLFDDLALFGNTYKYLCSCMNQTLIIYGHMEMEEDIYKGRILTEYLGGFFPDVLEKMLPSQYCTKKMICMFAIRFLIIEVETDGNMSQDEVIAFEDYRRKRIWNRMCSFWKASLEPSCRETIKAIHEVCPEVKLVFNLFQNLKYIENRESRIYDTMDEPNRGQEFDNLLFDSFFLTVPSKNVREKLLNAVMCLLESK